MFTLNPRKFAALGLDIFCEINQVINKWRPPWPFTFRFWRFQQFDLVFISRKVTPLYVHYKFDLGWNRDKPDPVNWPKCQEEDEKRVPDDDLDQFFRSFVDPTRGPETEKLKGNNKTNVTEAPSEAPKDETWPVWSSGLNLTTVRPYIYRGFHETHKRIYRGFLKLPL